MNLNLLSSRILIILLTLMLLLTACGAKSGTQNTEAVFTPADWAGFYTNSNFDDIMLTETGENHFEADVGFYRTASLEGTGVLTDKGIELTLTRFSGDTPLLALFALAKDGTYTITVTSSPIADITAGTVFEGFQKNDK